MAKKAEAKADKPKKNGGEKKKKWNKGKARDKLQNLVMFDASTLERLEKEVPSYKLITASVISDRLKIRGSLARRAIQLLLGKGLIKTVVTSSHQGIYTRAVVVEEKAAADTSKKSAKKDKAAAKAEQEQLQAELDDAAAE